MRKDQFIQELEEAGDAIINFLNSAGKVKYIVGTLDFTTKYIAEKHKQEKVVPESVIVFSWDEDKFKHIRYKRVVSVIPLNVAINNSIKNE